MENEKQAIQVMQAIASGLSQQINLNGYVGIQNWLAKLMPKGAAE